MDRRQSLGLAVGGAFLGAALASNLAQAATAATELRFIDTPSGRLAYRIDGNARAGQLPLVLLQRFRGTMADWDPAFIAALSAQRQVIRFDSAGVGRSEGKTPDNIAAMATIAQQFLAALKLKQVNILGWSMGGFIAQHLALDWPQQIRRVIVAGSGSGGVPEGPQTAAKVLEVATRPANVEADYQYLFFTDTPGGRAAGHASIGRVLNQSGRGPETAMASVAAQGQALGSWAGARTRLAQLTLPLLVANGVSDVMVPSYGAFVLAHEAPNAKLVLYPDAGHAFLFQYIGAFTEEVARFLKGDA
jgi:pimeloyl-ACP methyl ester carboxylesterase